MKVKQFFKQIWRWVRWLLAALVVAFVALVIYRIPAANQEQKTAATVAAIEAQHITLADVLGAHLPNEPYAPNNDATVAGIDVNNNGIRDDVELAIFKLHPDSAKIRAAELQYAMDQQIMMTEVSNSQTWIAAAQQDSRGYACLGQTVSNKNLSLLNQKLAEVKNLVLNTPEREAAWTAAYDFTTSYADLTGNVCDIDLNTLPN